MSTETFRTDLLNTKETDFLSALRALLTKNYLQDNLFELYTLMFSYNLSDINIDNIVRRYLEEETFDISTYDPEEEY